MAENSTRKAAVTNPVHGYVIYANRLDSDPPEMCGVLSILMGRVALMDVDYFLKVVWPDSGLEEMFFPETETVDEDGEVVYYTFANRPKGGSRRMTLILYNE